MGTQKVRVKCSGDNDLLARLDEFLGEEELVNVTFVCGGGKLKAHQVVLSACSTFFQDIFVSNPCSHPTVILMNVLYEDFATLLDIVYRRESAVPLERLESFLRTAKMFKVKTVIEVSSEDFGGIASSLCVGNRRSVGMAPAEARRNEPERGHTIVCLGQSSGAYSGRDVREASAFVENVNAKRSVTNGGSSFDSPIVITDENNSSGDSTVLTLSSASLNEQLVLNADATGAPSASSKFACGSSCPGAEEGDVSRVTLYLKAEPAGTEDVFVPAQLTFVQSLEDDQPQPTDHVGESLPSGTAVAGPVIVSTATCLTWYDDDLEDTSPDRDPPSETAYPSECALSEASTSAISPVACPSRDCPDDEQRPDCAFTETESETVQTVRGRNLRRNKSRVKTAAAGCYSTLRAIDSQSHKCAVCSMGFENEPRLRRHESAHSGNNQHLFGHCGAVFSRKDHLEHHMPVHSVAGKPYCCERCSKGFANKGNLNRHAIKCTRKSSHLQDLQDNASPAPVGSIKGGTGKGKEVAKPRCANRLSNGRTRRGHLEQDVLASYSKRSLRERRGAAVPVRSGKVSTGAVGSSSEKPFRCSRCEASFARWGNLRNHEVVHIFGAPFRCTYCPAAYERKRYRDLHMLVCPKKTR